jgi:hypothetical protein
MNKLLRWKLIHLDVSLGIKDTELEVTVTISPARQEKGYPPGFFEQTYGSCVDDPIVIDDEGRFCGGKKRSL